VSTLLRRLRTLYHNCVLHPIAGLLWFVGLQAAGDRVHGEPKPRWWIVEFEADGPRLMAAAELPPRPAHARPAAGDAFTPWEQAAEHLHVEAGQVAGAHVYAADEAGAYRAALNLVLANR